MSKSKKGFFEKQMDKATDKILEEMNKLLLWFFTVIVWDLIIKNLLIFTWKVLTSTVKNLPSDIKTIIKSKVERYTYLSTTITFILFVLINKCDYRLIIPCVFMYFILLNGFKVMKTMISKVRKDEKIKQLSKKHKGIVNRFAKFGLVKVLKESKDKVTLYSCEVTNKQINDHKEWLELYFNRKIAFIIRKKNNLKYNDVYFFIMTKFERYYRFDSYINLVIKNVKNIELPMILGIDQDNKFLIGDLVSIKYLFVAGEAGGGKSVLLNSIIQSLMIFTNNVLYILVDLKEGVEMSDYNSFPNCLICSTKEEFSQVIKELNKIMIERLRIIRETENCKNIQSYNAKKDTKNMNYIVLVIDEIAEIKLNSDKASGRSEEETILLQILQKGRAGGVHVIGATQRPGVDQIDGSVRAGFQKSISFCVSTPETQKMTKIHGTEQLKEGEFKTNILGKSNTIYKGFLILEEENKNKQLPKCNYVFEVLKAKLNKKVCLSKAPKQIEIKKNEDTKLNKWWHKITQKLNKQSHQKRHQKENDINFENLIKLPSKIVMENVKRFKELEIFNKNLQEKSNIYDGDAIFQEGDKFLEFLLYIYKNQQQDTRLPERPKIEKELDISQRLREKFYKDASEKSFINKCGSRWTISNNKTWESILKLKDWRD